jgi:hypothetical protein
VVSPDDLPNSGERKACLGGDFAASASMHVDLGCDTGIDVTARDHTQFEDCRVVDIWLGGLSVRMTVDPWRELNLTVETAIAKQWGAIGKSRHAWG